jgi:hypothetical protein
MPAADLEARFGLAPQARKAEAAASETLDAGQAA